MSDLLVIAAFIAFLSFFFAGRYRKFTAIAGWACIVLNLWSELPAFLQEKNFLYPALALLSLPFLAITAERLVRDDPVVLQLTRTSTGVRKTAGAPEPLLCDRSMTASQPLPVWRPYQRAEYTGYPAWYAHSSKNQPRSNPVCPSNTRSRSAKFALPIRNESP